MIPVTEKYRIACKEPVRSSYFAIKYGLYDKKAKGKINNVIAPSQPFVNKTQTYDEVKETIYNFISCEPNRVKLNGTFAFIQDKSTITTQQDIGYWSLYMSNEDGTFTNNPSIAYYFSTEVLFTDLTLHFQEVVSDMNIDYYYNENLLLQRKIRNNAKLEVLTTDGTNLASDMYFDKLVITFIKTKDPYRYIKFNEVDFGVYQTFKDDEIEDIDIIEEFSIDSSELSSNSLNITLKDYKNEYNILNPNNKLSLLQERQEVSVYHYLKVGLNYKEVSLGTFLLKNIDTGNQELKLECYDDTYFMNKIYYGSKFYENEEISTILKDLFVYFNYLNYEIDSELIGIKLTGYIPQVDMKEALRIIAEAGQCVITKDRYGITKIFKSFGNSVKLFSLNEYENEQAKKNLYNNTIDITEYHYTINDEESQLYNETIEKAGLYTITFNETPIVYKKYSNNYNLLKGNDNDYDIVQLYATSCVIDVKSDNQEILLKGFTYKDNIKTIRKTKNADIITDEYSISKIDNNLITSINSNEVGDWKLNRGEIKYNFNCLLTPYIETGDVCKLQIGFKDSKGNYIKKEFIPTYINYSKSLKQTIEGE